MEPADDPAHRSSAGEACLQARFGDCAVLSVSQQGGTYASGGIELRIAPAGVEPILKLAGEGGDVASRSTSAEDHAQIEASAESAQREAAQQRRRIDTQKVSISYSATGGEQGRSAIGQAFAESGRIFADSVAFLVRIAAGPIGRRAGRSGLM